MTNNSTRGASFAPGNLSRNVVRIKAGEVVKPKPFDKAEWHRRKAAEAHAKLSKEQQIETCYRAHRVPQVVEQDATPTMWEQEHLTRGQESIARLMRENRAAGL